MKQLAPIGITVYSRLEHFKRTIEALKKNTLSKQSVLYIFSDAPKTGDEKKVKKMRDYLDTIDGFKKVIIIKRQENNRIKNNRDGQKYLLDKYGKMIWMAEDIVTAPGYLQFMNDALEIYEDREDILSISGYTPNSVEAKKLDKDNFIFQVFLAWGLAIWKKEYTKVQEIKEKDYLSLINNQKRVDNIMYNCGKSYIKHFHDECYSSNNHFDIQATFLENLENSFTIYPKKSLVLNIGHDGSGLHSGITNKFEVGLWDKTENFKLDRNIKVDDKVKQDMASFFSPSKEDIDKSVVTNIVEKIYMSNLKSFSVWGTNQLTELVLKELTESNVKINYFICSWANDDTYYNGQKVITPQEALDKGEKNFIIMSFASRFKMRDSIVKMTKNDINIIMY